MKTQQRSRRCVGSIVKNKRRESGEAQREILNYLNDHGTSRPTVMAMDLAMTRGGIQSALFRLKKKGYTSTCYGVSEITYAGEAYLASISGEILLK